MPEEGLGLFCVLVIRRTKPRKHETKPEQGKDCAAARRAWRSLEEELNQGNAKLNLNREKIAPLPEEPDDPPSPFEIAAEWLKVSKET